MCRSSFSKALLFRTSIFENYLNKIVLMQSQPVLTCDHPIRAMIHTIITSLCFFQIVKERVKPSSLIKDLTSSAWDPIKQNQTLFVNPFALPVCHHPHAISTTSTRCICVWWRMTGSNRRPPACKAGALPAELMPRTDKSYWWVKLESNQRPPPYQDGALTD